MQGKRILRLTAAIVTLGMTSHAVAGPTPAQKCQSAKSKLAGKYDDCRQKAEAKFATTADGAARTAALQKCLDKYDAKWPATETKAMAAGGACPSVGDQATIRGFIDTATTDIATALAGGAAPACGAGEGQRLKTGQTTCYDAAFAAIACAGTGQDGELQKGLARSYTDNGDGTITDNRTGLMWEKLSDDGSIHDWDNVYTWPDAFAVKVAALNGGGGFAGYTDWQVPNVNELQGLVDYGAVKPKIDAAFNTSCAPGCTVLTCSCTAQSTGHTAYWSSSTYQYAPGAAWWVIFENGSVDAASKDFSHSYVRAVRDGS